jgi:hypothetical protein
VFAKVAEGMVKFARQSCRCDEERHRTKNAFLFQGLQDGVLIALRTSTSSTNTTMRLVSFSSALLALFATTGAVGWPFQTLLADATVRDASSEPDPPPYELPLHFENPRTDCKYVSQPWIADTFKNIATDFAGVFKFVAPDVKFRIMGHHPFAGAYADPKIAYVNSLHRLNNCLLDNKVDAKIWAIHGGCDDEWAIMELYFNATTKRGRQHRHKFARMYT